MSDELLNKYNRLRYENHSPEKEDFIDFIYENTELEAPEADIDAAWDTVSSKVNGTQKRSKTWMKIAASVVLILGACLFIWQISSPSELRIVASNEKVNVSFPDGSKGILNKNSTFSFPKEFKDVRLVEFSGEAFFDIKKSKKPFIIKTGDIEVKVLGTAFNLINSDSEVELYVTRGLVAFEKDGEQTNVPAGLKATFNKEKGDIQISKNPSVNITSWMNGTFVFEDTPLTNALKDLSRYYNFDYKLQNSKIGNCRITATFNKQSLSDIIITIESILDIKIESKDKQLKISGKGC